MSYIGGTPYDAGRCPECGGVTWNGKCEDPDCYHHWHPVQDDEPAPQTQEEVIQNKNILEELSC